MRRADALRIICGTCGHRHTGETTERGDVGCLTDGCGCEWIEDDSGEVITVDDDDTPATLADLAATRDVDGEWVRLVDVGCARVLEMRNPNDGQDPAPSVKSRYQYVRAGARLWTRHLPPVHIGDAWIDAGIPHWQILPTRDPSMRSVIDDYYDAAPDLSVAVVHRQRQQWVVEDGYTIRGEWVSADDAEDVKVLAGPITDAWSDVPLPPCPDCGGDLVWFEAGYVPGTRKCVGRPTTVVDDPAYPDGKRREYDTTGGCGSLFSVDGEHND